LNKKSIYKFTENTLSLFSIKAIDLGLTLWLIPYLILKIGIDNYGIYALAMSLILFFQNVLNYGFELSTVREVSKNSQNSEVLSKIFSEVISVKIVLLLILYPILLVLVLFVPAFWAQKSLYFFASLILIGDFFSLRWFFLGMEIMKYKALINLMSTIIFVILVLVVVHSKDDYKWIPLMQAISMTFISLISFFWVLKSYKIQLKFISFLKINTYLKTNFSSFLNLLLTSTYGILAVFFVGVFSLPVHVSYMQIGVKVTGAFSTLNTILTKVFFPIVNRKKSVIAAFKKVLLAVGVILSISMFFGSDFLISWWLKVESSVEQSNTINVIKILSPIPFLMAVISGYGVNGLLVFYKDVLYSKITLIATAIMIILFWLLIPNYHFYGGAIALLVGRAVYAVLTYGSFKMIKTNG